MTYNTKPFGFRRNVDFIIEWYKMQLVELKEYKINTYSSVISALFKVFAVMLFLYIVNENFFEILGWDRDEIVFFSLFSYFIHYLIGVFSHSNELDKLLLKGRLNTFLTQPVNVFFNYFLRIGKLRRVISGIIPFIILIIYLLIYSNVSWFRFIIGLIFSLYTGLFTLILYKTFDSFAFFMKNHSFMRENFDMIQNLYGSYPVPLFRGFLKNIAIFIPFVYYSSYVTMYVFGYINNLQLLVLSFYATLLMLFFGVILYLLWHFGLKKYEAFG